MCSVIDRGEHSTGKILTFDKDYVDFYYVKTVVPATKFMRTSITEITPNCTAMTDDLSKTRIWALKAWIWISYHQIEKMIGSVNKLSFSISPPLNFIVGTIGSLCLSPKSNYIYKKIDRNWFSGSGVKSEQTDKVTIIFIILVCNIRSGRYIISIYINTQWNNVPIPFFLIV